MALARLDESPRAGRMPMQKTALASFVLCQDFRLKQTDYELRWRESEELLLGFRERLFSPHNGEVHAALPVGFAAGSLAAARENEQQQIAVFVRDTLNLRPLPCRMTSGLASTRTH
ncbi:MAG TPA: hypothetical protein DHV85_06810 [Candidatus Accumulibacter sp.]|uniref:hypothetical protein n=1 Tax=Accumulibacter sp. TaxID=2053492 RepID=UPI000EED41F7|nr:hypothetical protein [Accumulibacter sp.]MBL8408155.1 hypothetical protein [Accumulibacter sp.]HCZ14297.1 hypothetical protein [Accumulibacter sp.]